MQRGPSTELQRKLKQPKDQRITLPARKGMVRAKAAAAAVPTRKGQENLPATGAHLQDGGLRGLLGPPSLGERAATRLPDEPPRTGPPVAYDRTTSCGRNELQPCESNG